MKLNTLLLSAAMTVAVIPVQSFAYFQLVPEHPILEKAPKDCLGVRHVYLHPGQYEVLTRPFGKGIHYRGRLSRYLSKTMFPEWGVRIIDADPIVEIHPGKGGATQIDLLDNLAKRHDLCVTVDWTHKEFYIAPHKAPAPAACRASLKPRRAAVNKKKAVPKRRFKRTKHGRPARRTVDRTACQ